jgi:superfamily II DNA or RNA helicase
MKNLKNIQFKLKYRSDNDSIFNDFMNPTLEQSVTYDRAAGYFTSSSLKMFSRGLEVFLHNEGKIRMICNPFLSSEDIEAIANGEIAKIDAITQSLLSQINITSELIQEDTLNILAWLIYQDILKIKIAVPINNALYHEKFGIFTDTEKNSVYFIGSANETYGGLVSNFEKIDVFTSDKDADRIDDAKSDFEALWENKTDGLEIFDFPDAVVSKILEYKKEFPVTKKEENIRVGQLVSRDYQTNAVREFEKNNYKGIFEMATGTGKTKTSLFASTKFLQNRKSVFVVILVPFIHLMTQWKKDCKLFDFEVVITCSGGDKKWLPKIENAIQRYNNGFLKSVAVIAVYKSANMVKFTDTMALIKENSMLIADECHYFGTNQMRHNRFETFDARLGLSATPQRWWDEEGTEFLMNYFNKVVFEYTLKEAIDNQALCEYEYFPIYTTLNNLELLDYQELSVKIAALMNSDDENDKAKLEILIIERALILKKAENKKLLLYKELSKLAEHERNYILVYCAPTDINEVTNQIHDIGYRVSKFDHTAKMEQREVILRDFEKGDIQILVAMKCLDEGVDVPATRTAYFLASTSNPKEFIQRRGRILRPFQGKRIAKVIDYFIFGNYDDLNIGIMSKELPRFVEFNQIANNKYQNREHILRILEPINMQHLLNYNSWDIYKKYKEKHPEDKDA